MKRRRLVLISMVPTGSGGNGKKTLLRLFFEQLNSMLIFILVAAAGISALLGEPTDTVIILCVIALNAVIGVVQEAKAEKASEAL